MNVIEKLKELYADGSKHDNYQNLPVFVQKELGFNVTIDENWRGDTARYNYFVDTLKFKAGEKIADIGANTGFFTLSLADKYPQSTFIAYELNPQHVHFINEIAAHFKMANVQTRNIPVDMVGAEKMETLDYMLHFNVLHHAGVDFDKEKINDLPAYREYCIKYLSLLKNATTHLIYQMGYNWGGNKLNPIIPLQNDLEKITYTLDLFSHSGWKLNSIALCRKVNGTHILENVPQHFIDELLIIAAGKENASQDLMDYLKMFNFEGLSEFYRRPIFNVSK